MFRKRRNLALLVLTSVMMGGLLLCSATSQAQTLQINVYSQTNSTWSKDKLGGTNLTIGSHGCMMTCVAAALRVTPKTLNDWLNANSGYDAGNLRHDKAAAYDGAGGLQYSGRGTVPSDAAAVGRGIGRGAVYLARSTRFSGRDHWVLIYDSNGSQAYYLDPWDGTTRRVNAVDAWVKYGAEARVYSLR